MIARVMHRAYRKFFQLAITTHRRKRLCKNAHQFITKVSNIIPMERWQSDEVVI